MFSTICSKVSIVFEHSTLTKLSCIDVSKDKHDCFIVSSEGEVLSDVFTIPNTMDGFHCLLQRIQDCTNTQEKIKVRA